MKGNTSNANQRALICLLLLVNLFLSFILCSTQAKDILFRRARIQSADKAGENLLSMAAHSNGQSKYERARTHGARTGLSVPKQLVIQFKKSLSSQETKQVEQELDIRLNRYVPHNAFIIYTTEPNVLLERSAQMQELIDFVGHVKPQYKTGVNVESIQFHSNQNPDATPLLKTPSTGLHGVDPYPYRPPNEPQDSVELHVQLVQELKLAQERVNRWNDDISQLSEPGIVEAKLSLVSRSKALLEIKRSHHPQGLPIGSFQQSVLNYLTGQEEVSWIELKTKHTIHNNGANAITQSGSTFSDRPHDSHIMWKQGITGRGEVVAIGDTGIDHDNCLFLDKHRNVPFNRIDHSHRKIVGYYQMETNSSSGRRIRADTKDSVNGHGTHVAGSVAGSAESSNPNATEIARYNGIAMEAKIMFLDFMNDRYPGLIIPDDLYEDYFPVIYDAGVRISSNSWGCSYGGLWTCEYDCQCKWAQSTEFGRVGSRVSDEWCMEQLDGKRCCEFCNRYDSQTQEVDRFLHEHDDMIILFAAGNDGASSSKSTLGSPATAKNALTVGASMNNNDEFIESIRHMDFLEYLGVYSLSSLEKCCRYASFDCMQMKKAKMHCCPGFMHQQYTNRAGYFSSNNVAAFSSRGPASVSGRIKPDVVAPGHMVQSAHSDGVIGTNNCGTESPRLGNAAAIMTMKGTSMATPITAGSVALIRQYFREHYENKINHPSGLLLKAAVIHASQPMSGQVDLDNDGSMKDLPQNPNIYNGYGLVRLDTVLQLPSSDFDLHAENRHVFNEEGEQYTMCFRNSGSTDGYVKATMTWYDPPSSLQSPDSLINILYLKGRAVDSKGSVLSQVSDDDDVNNVRQIHVSIRKGETAKVIVRAHVLQRAPQSWGLVATSSKTVSQIQC